jgi:single-strand DNA-binding protein
MIFSTITGNLGRDAELKDTRGGPVLSFSVASEEKIGQEKTTTWIRCSLFGKRATALALYLVKGTKVAVFGPIRLHEYQGKTSLECSVSELVLMGGGRQQTGERPASEPQPQPQPQRGGGGYSETDYPEDVGDAFPF